MNCLSLT